MFNTEKVSTSSKSVFGSFDQCDAVDDAVDSGSFCLFANSVSSSRKILFSLKNFITPFMVFGMIGYVTGGCKSESVTFTEEWETLKSSICRLINDTQEGDLIELLGDSVGNNFPLSFPVEGNGDLNFTDFIDVFFNASLMIYSMINDTDTGDSPCYDYSHKSCANITRYMLDPPVESADRGPIDLVFLLVGFVVLCLLFGVCVISSYSVRNSRSRLRNMVV
ncbi:putative membrane protein [Candidatus Ichthyocystis hellenicum]|uniref:Putative membrane protein n=1 Tax=Candidatus Ichthyocystis hellenicum TaxID=1561003 RepID=A0A0S4M3N9_9BURK|nr:hypothetical protein [Candidatus Ichthyocystis hellenicum]CUT18389.1 putative membrane protein [Candidatus Ichthyocystis hellenicum]